MDDDAAAYESTYSDCYVFNPVCWAYAGLQASES